MKIKIKGVCKDLYLTNKSIGFMNLIGNTHKILYTDIHQIDYFLDKPRGSSYAEFTLHTGKKYRYEFWGKRNDDFSDALNIIKEKQPDAIFIEHFSSELKLYQQLWFQFLLCLFCCMPVGIILMWYHKTANIIVRIELTILFAIIPCLSIYISYTNYQTAISNIQQSYDTSSSLIEQVNESTNSVPNSTDMGTDNQTESFKSGTYKVGKDIPAGEYVLFCEEPSAYFEISKDSNNTLDSITANDIFNTNSIITVENEQYLSFSSAYAIPITEADIDTTTEGMFKVGKHIEAGEYLIQCYNDETGYIEVSKDSSHSLNSIVSNDIIESFSYITVEKGQYLKLSGCYIAEKE